MVHLCFEKYHLLLAVDKRPPANGFSTLHFGKASAHVSCFSIPCISDGSFRLALPNCIKERFSIT